MIAQNWSDKTIYYVGFLAEPRLLKKESSDKKYRKIYRTLVLPPNLSEREVQVLISKKFEHVVEVILVEELSDGLLLN